MIIIIYEVYIHVDWFVEMSQNLSTSNKHIKKTEEFSKGRSEDLPKKVNMAEQADRIWYTLYTASAGFYFSTCM